MLCIRKFIHGGELWRNNATITTRQLIRQRGYMARRLTNQGRYRHTFRELEIHQTYGRRGSDYCVDRDHFPFLASSALNSSLASLALAAISLFFSRSLRLHAATTSKTSVYVGRRKLISRRAIAGSARKRGKWRPRPKRPARSSTPSSQGRENGPGQIGRAHV